MEAALPDDRLAGRYVLQEVVGASGVTDVWRARDLVLARPVAVKILRRDRTRGHAIQERFLRGASAAARLAHPGIVRVFDAGVQEGMAYVVVEDTLGEPLRALLGRTGPLPPDVSARMIAQVLAALGYAHEHGVLHEGLGAGTVLVTPGERTKVTDFAMSPAALGQTDAARTGDEAFNGLACVSPEQSAGREATARSDVYAAGAVLYEMLTSRPPFETPPEGSDAPHHPARDPTPPGAVRGGVPRGLDDAVVRAMALRPEERFATAHAMRAAVEPFAGTVARRAELHSTAAAQAPGPRHSEGDPHVAGDGQRGGQAMSALRSWMLVPLVVLALAAAAIAAGLALGRLQIGGPLGITAAQHGAPRPAPGATFSPIPTVRAEDFDPFGNDHHEHPQQAPLAVDADTGTAWTTDHYTTAAFGNLKAGVGLWLDFGRDRDVRRVTITSSIPGWTFEVRSGPSPASPPAGLDPYSPPVPSVDRSTEFTVGSSETVTVDLRPFHAAGVLIWITRLAPDSGGYAASISEASVAGRPS